MFITTYCSYCKKTDSAGHCNKSLKRALFKMCLEDYAFNSWWGRARKCPADIMLVSGSIAGNSSSFSVTHYCSYRNVSMGCKALSS